MRVSINKFKQLDNVSVELTGITLLIGGNNAGKSSILQAIQFGVSVAQATSLLTNAIWKHDKLPTSIGQNEFMYLPIKDLKYLARQGQLKEGRDKAINIKYTNGEYCTDIFVSKGRNKNISISMEGETLGKDLQFIDNPFSMLVTGLAGIPNEEKYLTPLVVKKAAARGDSNSVFRNILLLLREDEDSWSDFSNEIEGIFPGYQIDVSFDKDRDEFIRCNIKKDEDNIWYPIDSCGTGILQVIQILSYIYLFKPKILLLDEPDSHLHPDNQRLLANRLIHITEQTNTKILIATHSKYLVDELIDTASIIWMSQGKIQTCDNNKIVQCLMDIGALNIGERLTPPSWVLLTEDTKTDLLKTFLTENGANLSDGEIKSYKGCTKIDTAQALLEHLKESFPNARFIIHRDRDFLDDEKLEAYKEKFRDFDVYFLIPDNNDIESYFISIGHLRESLQIGDEDAKTIIYAALSTNKHELAEKYANVKKQIYDFKDQSNRAASLVTEALKEFENGYNPKFIHGKEMLKAIRRELSKRKINDCINSPSQFLKIPNIHELFKF